MIRRDFWHVERISTGERIMMGGWAGIQHWLDQNGQDGLRWHLAPMCGCCGSMPLFDADVTLQEVEQGVHRCQKHVGRLPCYIEGCGRTFRMDGDDTYGHVVICGQHWRQAPKYMREAVSRIRMLAKRRGWTDALYRRHHRLWWRTYRAIVQGRTMDVDEINKLFGWDDPAEASKGDQRGE